MEYVFGIIILLGALVFFHEIGHFLVAKLCGVKVEVFSLGFGSKLIKKRIGETEYCLSLIPLGGYVKLFGEDPTRPVIGEEAKRSFSNQPVGRRFVIAAAGPVFNIIFAIVVYFMIEVTGLEQVIVPYFADVEVGSPAWEAGLRAGDTVTKVDGKAIQRYDHFLTALAKSPGKSVSVTVNRKNQPFETNVTLLSEEQWNMFCEKEKVGVLKGTSIYAPRPVLGITNPYSWAGQAGLRSGDIVLSLNGVPLQYWHQLKDYLTWLAQRDLVFKVWREGREMLFNLSLPAEYFMLNPEQKERFWGIHSYEFFIKEEFKGGTAGQKAGLKRGDRLVAINDVEIKNWDEFREKVQLYGKNPGYFSLTYERLGQMSKIQIYPVKGAQSLHPCEKEKDFFQIGVVIDRSIDAPPKVQTWREANPFKAFASASSKSFYMMFVVFKSIGKMIQGKVSLKSMGGPILIGKIAGDQLKQGLYPFLALLAMISLNLAVLNLLPIPVLDGGHLFFFTIEAIFRRPLSQKVLEFANRAGLVIILGLIVLSFYNDISRYWTGIVGFLKRIIGMV